MARHNRDGSGTDQREREYRISYQPDWLNLVKVTRTLPSGRQSTKTLFRNTEEMQRSPGPSIRTGIVSPEQGIDFEITLRDPGRLVRRLIVETEVPGEGRGHETVVFSIEDALPPPGNRGR